MSDRPHFAHLELIIGGETRRIELPATRICRFGRGPDNTVVIADQLASRNHALIDCRNEREYFLTDLGSRNGTFLNGSRVLGPARLSEGDRINVGEQTFLFRDAIQRNAFEATPSQVQTEVAQPTVMMVSLE